MRREFRRSLLVLLAALALPLSLGGCAAAVANLKEQVDMATHPVRTVKQGVSGMSAAFGTLANRKLPSNLAGTYKLTYTFTGQKPITVYVRTLNNHNTPIMTTGPDGMQTTKIAYMSNAMGGATLAEVPDTLAYDSASLKKFTVGGMLIVLDSLAPMPDGTQRFRGAFVLNADSMNPATRPLALGLLKGAMDDDPAFAAAVKAGKGKDFEPKEVPCGENVGPCNLFDAIQTTIYLHPDKSVSWEQKNVIQGKLAWTIEAERISRKAWGVPGMVLSGPAVDETADAVAASTTQGAAPTAAKPVAPAKAATKASPAKPGSKPKSAARAGSGSK